MVRPVDSVENMAIKCKVEGLRLKQPGDGMATLFFNGDFGRIFWLGGGGRIEVAICNQAGKLDRTTQLPTSTTLQSTSIRGGGG